MQFITWNGGNTGSEVCASITQWTTDVNALSSEIETAETNASDAKDLAETARDEAEILRDETQAIKDSIDSSTIPTGTAMRISGTATANGANTFTLGAALASVNEIFMLHEGGGQNILQHASVAGATLTISASANLTIGTTINGFAIVA